MWIKMINFHCGIGLYGRTFEILNYDFSVVTGMFGDNGVYLGEWGCNPIWYDNFLAYRNLVDRIQF